MLEKLTLRASSLGVTAKVLTQSGIIRPYSPKVLAGLLKTVLAWGTGPAGGFATLALRAPDDLGVIDELGSLTSAPTRSPVRCAPRASRRATASR